MTEEGTCTWWVCHILFITNMFQALSRPP